LRDNQFFFRFVAENANKRGIYIDDAVLPGVDNVDAFLQCFKEFGEARFIAAKSGDVARQNSDAVHNIISEPWRGRRNRNSRRRFGFSGGLARRQTSCGVRGKRGMPSTPSAMFWPPVSSRNSLSFLPMIC